MLSQPPPQNRPLPAVCKTSRDNLAPQLHFPTTGNWSLSNYPLDKPGSYFFCLPEKKLPRKRQPMLRQLLDLSKKASGRPLEFSRRLGQFQFPLHFLASPKTPTTQRRFSEVF